MGKEMKESMDKLSLGDRMKQYYENLFNQKLPMRMPVIIRLDGKSFHSFTKKFDKPFDKKFIEIMQCTALFLCKNIQGAQIAYVQSDEISILVHNYKRLNSCAWFDNKIQKIASISAGLASSYFSLQIQPYLELEENKKVVVFDSRVFVLPETEVCNYFIWRQQDWERNSIQMLAQSLYSHNQLYKKNNSELQEMCFQKNKNWNNLDIHLKRGSCVYKTCIDTGNWTNEISNIKIDWVVDKGIPVFTQDRSFIEKWLEIEEE